MTTASADVGAGGADADRDSAARTSAWDVYSEDEFARLERAQIGWKTLVILAFAALMAGVAIWSSRSASPDITHPVSVGVFAGVAASLLVFAFGPAILDRAGSRASVLAHVGGVLYWFALPILQIDKALRGPIAFVCGLRIHGWAPRYALLVLHVGLAAVLVWLIPMYWPSVAWLGYVGLGWALVALIAVVRTWIWIENEYERRAQGYESADMRRYPQLRDEALFAVLLFFAAVPVVLWKLGGTFDLFTAEPGAQVAWHDWIALFGAELVKAIPLVDWAEVYNVGSTNVLTPTAPLGLATIFITRVIVDLVLIGALFYAIERVGQISRQWREFLGGRRRLLDPSLEQRVLCVLRTQADAAAWFEDEPPVRLGHFANYESSRLRALALKEEDDPVDIAIVLHAACEGAPNDVFVPLARDLLLKTSSKRASKIEPALELAVRRLGKVDSDAARDLLGRVLAEFDLLNAIRTWQLRALAAKALTSNWRSLADERRTNDLETEVVSFFKRGLAKNTNGSARQVIGDQLANVGGGPALDALSGHLENEQAATVLRAFAHDMSRMRASAPSDYLRRAAEHAKRRAAELQRNASPTRADKAAIAALDYAAKRLESAAEGGVAAPTPEPSDGGAPALAPAPTPAPEPKAARISPFVRDDELETA